VTVPVIDQELVIHVFSPVEGPHAAVAYQQVSRLWSACRDQLGMTEPIPGVPAAASPPGTLAALTADEVVAAQESRDASRQAVLYRVHDVLVLSAALAQPLPGGLRRPPAWRPDQPPAAGQPPGRQAGWAEWGQLWSRASAGNTSAVLGEARLFLARVPGDATGAVAATPALGQFLEPLLPYREDRAREWWRRGTTTSSGYALWDTSPGDTDRGRDIVVVAAADRDDELSAWAWSDGPAELAPFTRYLLHAAKLRYEARLLESWKQRPPGADIAQMLAELGVALAPDAAHPGQAGLLRSWLRRLRAEERRLQALEADLERLSQTVAIACDNVTAAAGPDAGQDGAGMFASDRALGRWLARQVDDDLGYLRIDLAQTRRTRELAAEEAEDAEEAEEPGQTVGAGAAETAAAPRQAPRARRDEAAAASPHPDTARRVFVVYGRDSNLTSRFFDLLRAVDLRPMEWETLVQATGRAAPAMADVVAGAPHLAQATLVLLSPDDIVELHSDLALAGDARHERDRGAQARPNVLFELGMALMAYPDKTVIVEIGDMRPLSDLAGLNVIRFDGSATAIRKVLGRLELAGCAVDYTAQDWLDPGRFAGLPAYRRGPGTHRAAAPPGH
jgi:predicted nucleotide-binding protein